MTSKVMDEDGTLQLSADFTDEDQGGNAGAAVWLDRGTETALIPTLHSNHYCQ